MICFLYTLIITEIKIPIITKAYAICHIISMNFNPAYYTSKKNAESVKITPGIPQSGCKYRAYFLHGQH
jgi:hypothetical protein